MAGEQKNQVRLHCQAEECVLVRDEMANMVCGVETLILLPLGIGRSGSGAAAETSAFYQGVLFGGPAAPRLPNNATVRYEVMNGVSEHGIAIIPVHLAKSEQSLNSMVAKRSALNRTKSQSIRQPNGNTLVRV